MLWNNTLLFLVFILIFRLFCNNPDIQCVRFTPTPDTFLSLYIGFISTSSDFSLLFSLSKGKSHMHFSTIFEGHRIFPSLRHLLHGFSHSNTHRFIEFFNYVFLRFGSKTFNLIITQYAQLGTAFSGKLHFYFGDQSC